MEQLDKLKQEYNGFRQKALALTEKTQAEDRSLTDAEMAAIEEHVKAAKGLRPEIERMERGLRVMELVGRASDHHFGVKDGDPRAEGRRAAASVGRPRSPSRRRCRASRRSALRAFDPAPGALDRPVPARPARRSAHPGHWVAAVAGSRWPGRHLPAPDREDEPGRELTTPVRGRYASPPSAVVSAPKARRTV